MRRGQQFRLLPRAQVLAGCDFRVCPPAWSWRGAELRYFQKLQNFGKTAKFLENCKIFGFHDVPDALVDSVHLLARDKGVRHAIIREPKYLFMVTARHGLVQKNI